MSRETMDEPHEGFWDDQRNRSGSALIMLACLWLIIGSLVVGVYGWVAAGMVSAASAVVLVGVLMIVADETRATDRYWSLREGELSDALREVERENDRLREQLAHARRGY